MAGVELQWALGVRFIFLKHHTLKCRRQLSSTQGWICSENLTTKIIIAILCWKFYSKSWWHWVQKICLFRVVPRFACVRQLQNGIELVRQARW